ncbi:hypothetical protein GCM10027612_75490 [Microbispora bryophytorum subsp. camponoti]
MTTPASLVDRHVGFVHALREAGLPVSPAEGLDAAHALMVVDLTERETLREAYAATLVKRPAHRPGFDLLFDLWFPPVIGGTQEGPKESTAESTTEGAAVVETAAPPELPELRERLAELLMGDPADPAFREFARAMVGRFGQVQAAPGRQSWFSFPVLRALSPETLVARMLTAMLDERGGLPEKVARRHISRTIEAFTEAVASDVRRRIAEESGIEKIARSAVRPPIDRVDFLRATKEELARLRREVYPSPAAWPPDCRSGRSGGGAAGSTSGAPCGPRCPRAACRSPPTCARPAPTGPSWSCCATPATRSPRSRTSRCC